MALSPVELREEALGQLRQLAQSPGWALYVARLRSLGKSREEAKANALRAYEVSDAVYFQGVSDGIDLAIRELDRYHGQLKDGDGNLPTRAVV